MAKRIRLKVQDAVLAFAMIMGSMTGAILCMLTIWLGKGLLPGWLETMYMLIGGIVWLGLMTVYFCLCNSEKGKRILRIKKLWPDVLKAELWILAVFYLRMLLEKLCTSLLAPYLGSGILRTAVSLLLIFAAVWGAVFFVHRLLRQCGFERAVKGFGGVLLTVGMLSLEIAGLWAACLLWNWFSGQFSPTIVSVLASHLFMAGCGYGAVWIFMAVVCKKKDSTVSNKQEELASDEEKSKKSGETAQVTSGEDGDDKEPISADENGELGEGSMPESAISSEIVAAKEVVTKEAVSKETVTKEELHKDEITSTKGVSIGEESISGKDAETLSAGETLVSERSPENVLAGEVPASEKETENVLAEGSTIPEKNLENVPTGEAPTSGKTSAASAPQGMLKNIVGIGIPLVLSVALLVLTSDFSHEETAEDKAAAAIAEPLSAGYASLEEGNLTEAGSRFATAQARARALESLMMEETSGRLRSLYAEYPNDTFIAALYLSYAEDVDRIEDKVISHTLGNEWYPILLRYYREQETLTGKQELLRNEILLQCIVNEQYVRKDYLFAADVTENRLAVQRRLKNYEEDLIVCKVFGLMEQYGMNGGYTAEAAYDSLELAEEYTDNALLQYIACRIAGSYQVDSAEHYGRTIEAAARFDRLYDDGTRSQEQLIREKMFLGDVATRCYDYEAALAYYEASFALSGDSAVALSCAEIHEKQKEYEQCIELVGEVLQKEPENGKALYLMAIASLKTRDLDGALDAAGRLGDLMADENRTPDFEEENYLYNCAQYLSMNDSGNWTDFRWNVYGSLSEEQIASVKEHRLLWDYMTAINKCFMAKDYEAAGEAVDNIMAVRDDLATGWYLRGTIAFSAAYTDRDNTDFRQILGYYEKAVDCGGIAPAVYFSIANVYDAMEDYENALLYARKVEEMLPYQDHGNDVYGISVHNRNLLRSVSAKLGR